MDALIKFLYQLEPAFVIVSGATGISAFLLAHRFKLGRRSKTPPTRWIELIKTIANGILVCAAFLVLLVACLSAYAKTFFTLTPNVLGYSISEAEQKLADYELGIEPKEEQNTSDDVITGQIPDAGTPIRKGSNVEVTFISLSPPPPTPTPTSSEPTSSEPTPSEPTPSEPTPSEPTPSEPTPSEPTPSEPSIQSVSLSQSFLSLDVYSSEILSVFGGNGTYSWSSSNPAVADVTDDGEVFAKADGRAKITVSSGGESATCIVTTQTKWSEWMDQQPNVPNNLIQTRTVYRYRNKEKCTMESRSNFVEGWIQYDNFLYYGDWSDWCSGEMLQSPNIETEARQVKTADGHTEYRYGRWYNSIGVVNWCAEYSEREGGTCTIQYSDWSTQQLSHRQNDVFTCGCTDAEHPRHTHVAAYSDDGRAWWIKYDGNWFWEESRWVDAAYETQYRSREVYTIYCYYMWKFGTWSSWSETPYYSNGDSLDVESMTQYRYIITT